jgi:hypothetical protein
MSGPAHRTKAHSNNRIIDVKPLAQGWTVRSEQRDYDLVFRSGRAAEQAAVRLADRLAKAGIPSEIPIHLKDGARGGRFFSPVSRPVESIDVALDHSRALEPI